MCVTESECITAKCYLQISSDEKVRKCQPHFGCMWIGHRCVTSAECESLGGERTSYAKCEREDQCSDEWYEHEDGVCVDEEECLSVEGRLLYVNVNVTRCLDDFDDCAKKGGVVQGDNCYTRDQCESIKNHVANLETHTC